RLVQRVHVLALDVGGGARQGAGGAGAQGGPAVGGAGLADDVTVVDLGGRDVHRLVDVDERDIAVGLVGLECVGHGVDLVGAHGLGAQGALAGGDHAGDAALIIDGQAFDAVLGGEHPLRGNGGAGALGDAAIGEH